MGKFKDNLKRDKIHEWLLSKGYRDEYKDSSSWSGLRKVYRTDYGDFAHVIINLQEKTVYVYKETFFDSFISDWNFDIKDEWLENLELFIDEIDDLLDGII